MVRLKQRADSTGICGLNQQAESTEYLSSEPGPEASALVQAQGGREPFRETLRPDCVRGVFGYVFAVLSFRVFPCLPWQKNPYLLIPYFFVSFRGFSGQKFHRKGSR